jgi:hypothetical protein
LGVIVRGSDRVSRLVIDTDKYPGLVITLEAGEVEHKADGEKRGFFPKYEQLMEWIKRTRPKP